MSFSAKRGDGMHLHDGCVGQKGQVDSRGFIACQIEQGAKLGVAPAVLNNGLVQIITAFTANRRAVVQFHRLSFVGACQGKADPDILRRAVD